MDPCPGISGDITQYQISFQTGSVVVAENVTIAECTAGRCSHTFEPPSNPPSSYDSVSVAAENVVGVGAARTCTTQTISELNLIMLQYHWHSCQGGKSFRSQTATVFVIVDPVIEERSGQEWRLLCT